MGSLRNDLQREPYTVHTATKQLRMKISPLKSKLMVFTRQIPIRSKIVTDNTILEEINTFTYLGCNISYEKVQDMT
jgi:hypothetical protein